MHFKVHIFLSMNETIDLERREGGKERVVSKACQARRISELSRPTFQVDNLLRFSYETEANFFLLLVDSEMYYFLRHLGSRRERERERERERRGGGGH